MADIPIERSVAIGKARGNIEASLREYGLSWTMETKGRDVVAARCVLYNGEGSPLDSGYGKGEADAAIAGALFEAAEHWFSRFSNCNKGNIVHRQSWQFLEQEEFAADLPASLIRETQNAMMAFRKYKRVRGCEERIYPVAFSSPGYVDDLSLDPAMHPPDAVDYARIGDYCSNSGTAIGSVETDATIHGVLEAIERDTLSRFLVTAFLERDKKALRVVNPDSLPDDLRELHWRVETEVNHRILVLELENRYGVPVFCAALQKSPFLLELVGYGCSLSREHAVKRSLYELTQCYHLTTGFHPREFEVKMRRILSNLKDQPFHLRCAKLKLTEWCERIGSIDVPWSETACLHVPEGPDAYLGGLIEVVEANGGRVYSSVVNELKGSAVITHSFLEGQDHFFCVTNGAFVLPTLASRYISTIA